MDSVVGLAPEADPQRVFAVADLGEGPYSCVGLYGEGELVELRQYKDCSHRDGLLEWSATVERHRQHRARIADGNVSSPARHLVDGVGGIAGEEADVPLIAALGSKIDLDLAVFPL